MARLKERKTTEGSQANNGGEYSGPFESYYKLYGIRLEKMPAKMP